MTVEGICQAVMRRHIQRLDGPVGPALPGTRQDVRCPGHGFLAPGDDDGGITAADHAGCVNYCRETGKAHLVDGDRGDVPTDAGTDGTLPCRVLAGSGLQNLAHDYRVHLVRADAAGGEGRLDGMRPEFHRREAGQLAVEAALRRAGRGEDDNIVVVCGVAHGYLFRSVTMYAKAIVSRITYPFKRTRGGVHSVPWMDTTAHAAAVRTLKRLGRVGDGYSPRICPCR